MFSFLIRAFLVLSLFFQVHAAGSSKAPAISTLWTFPNGTWIENIQVLKNGSLLVSSISQPHIWMMDPTIANSNPQVAYTFENATSALGMTEIAPNIIAIAAGNLSSATLKAVPGSFAVYIFDFSPLQSSGPTLLAKHPVSGSGLLNGMTTLPNAPGYLLLADSDLGCIWRLNLYNGDTVSYKDDLFGKAPNVSSSALNGIQVAQGPSAPQISAKSAWSDQLVNESVDAMGSTYLYFTNSNTDIMGRIAITRDGLPLTTTTRAVKLAAAPNQTSYDDFAIAPDGSFILIADWIGTSVLSYNVATGVQKVAAGAFGNVQPLDHPTSVRWANDEFSAVYVSTAGWFGPFGGTGGGQVLRIAKKP